MLTPDQKALAHSLLDELLDVPEAQRWSRLRGMRVDDSAVLAEIESLLRAAQASGDFMATPARPMVTSLDESIAAGTRFGQWQVTGRVGRGGMGDVYKAVRAEGDFEQRVAIKLLHQDSVAQTERFQVERQILARLEHPGIARLYDGGVAPDGRPYMVMEFVEGRTLTEYCEQTGATLDQRLELFTQVCDAVAYAHRNLIVHRDLKPSNILVTADGDVKLLDFGIAKPIDAERAALTQAADAPLTPMCAAPEQLLGKPITTATDVYALGLLLFELLTGSHPWVRAGGPILQALRTAMNQPAPVPSKVAQTQSRSPVPARLMRGDLDAIVAKSLREEPTHRYVTVEALKLDIERVRRGEPVEARAGARLYVFGRTLRRYRWGVAAVVLIVVSLAGGLGAAAWQAQRAQIERDIARRDAAREEAVRYNITQMFRTAIADQGSHQQPATAKSMIDSSAQRVLREYHDKPLVEGQIVLTLADLYGALEDAQGGAALLDGFIAEAGPQTDPSELADAQQKLANLELLRGNADHAAKLLAQADAFWARSPSLYTEERLEGLGTQAKLQRMRGDLNGAIATSREALPQRLALSGRNDRETALLYNTLAITLTAANQLQEALSAYRETMDIYRAIGLADGLDAQIILANIGTLDLRTGNLRDAESSLKAAYEREQALAGDSAAVAAAMGYYGKVLTIRNRLDQALPTLHQAADLATKYTGPGSPLTLQNRLFLGEAQLTGGDTANAREAFTAIRDTAVKQYGNSHPLALRAGLALADVSARTNHRAEAQQQLIPVIEGLRKAGAAAQTNLAQALEDLGDLQLVNGQTQAAVATLQEAVGLREKTSSAGWELGEARERLGEAIAVSGNQTASSKLLHQAEDILDTQLGRDHPESVRARKALEAATHN